MTPTWYDLLGLEPDATPDEIRAAWKAAIADLDPGDRRFRTLNEAAEILLDPQRRAAYDATLAPEQADETQAGETQAEPPLTRQKLRGGAKRGSEVSDVSAESGAQAAARSATNEEQDPRTETERDTEKQKQPTASGWTPPGWLLVVLAVLTALSLAAVVYLLQQPSDADVADATKQAQTAAEQAAPVILSYDYRHLDADQKAADALLTPEYRKEYDKLFGVIRENAGEVKPIVTANVVASGVVRTGEDRVQLLVLLDRHRTNAQGAQPDSHDQVRVTMVRDGDDWLVDKMDTQPLPS